MGVVYKARQARLNRLVALKMILAGQLASADDVRRFQIEAEAVGNLDHPNIVPVYEAGEYEGQHYLSMKLIAGSNFAQEIADGDWSIKHKAAQKRVARLLSAAARAVHHAHQRGILHRDLKPANILLNQRREPCLTDFGLAKRLDRNIGLTQTGTIVGTVSYMAPEQAAAEKGLTTAVDIYGLGAILYELLTGRPPFQGGMPLETLRQIREQAPVRPRAINSCIDRDLETICLKCLEKDPANRYGSAELFADDLENWLHGKPIQARPVRAWERLAKWARRRPAIATLVAAVVVILLVSSLGVAWQRYREDSAYRQLQVEVDSSTRAERYFKGIEAATRALEKGQVGDADEQLEACEPELREVEWYLLRALCHGPVSIPLTPDLDHSHQFGLTPDHQHFAWFSAWPYGVLSLYEPATGRQIRSFGANGFAVSPDGRLLAGSTGNDVTVWDVFTGEVLQIFPLEQFGRSFFTIRPVIAGLKDRLREKRGPGQGWGEQTFREIPDKPAEIVSPDGRLTFGRRQFPSFLPAVKDSGPPPKMDSRGNETGRGLKGNRRWISDGVIGLYASRNGMLLLNIRDERDHRANGRDSGGWFLGFSQDGRRFLTCEGSSICVWECESIRKILTAPGIRVANGLRPRRDQFLGFLVPVDGGEELPPSFAPVASFDGETIWWLDMGCEIKFCDLRPR
jgi:tRNA A-37 threonylcarbamoyl transferase component Bud32